MHLPILTFAFLVGVYGVPLRPMYLVIPLDEAKLIQPSSEFFPKPSMERFVRRTEAFVPAALATVHTENIEPPSRMEKATTRILDYVDFGGHTGENGAFGWYADFPANQ